ncbi:MFS transporter [Nonomuraea sp. NPDC048892]|uniref:MFS transporter n=1 Tax=Nonomuraea sp. NPDC048892 TaxID=3154624 RepID=UPI0033FA6EDD
MTSPLQKSGPESSSEATGQTGQTGQEGLDGQGGISYRKLLRNVPFALLWLTLAQSALGDQFFKVGVPWHATQQFGNVFDGALVGMAMALPLTIFGLCSGVLVDRFNRFGLLLGADLVRMAITGAIAAALATSMLGLPGLLAGVILLTVPSTLYMPAVQTIVPRLAGGHVPTIARMDALLMGSATTMTVLGPSITGLALTVVPLWALLGIDAVTFGIAALLIVAIRVKAGGEMLRPTAAKPSRSLKGILSAVREGLRFIMTERALRAQFLVYPALDGAQYSIVFILPGFLLSYGDGGTVLFGVAVAAIGVGRVAGMFTVTHTFLLRRRGLVFVGNFFVQGLAILVMCVGSEAWLAPLAMFFVGLPAGMATVSVSTYVQSVVPEEMRGRVFASIASLSSAAMPVAPLLFGLVATSVSASVSLMCIAATFILGSVYLMTQRGVREVL